MKYYGNPKKYFLPAPCALLICNPAAFWCAIETRTRIFQHSTAATAMFIYTVPPISKLSKMILLVAGLFTLQKNCKDGLSFNIVD